MKITLAHSPDADDAFMFYGLASGNINTGDLTIEHKLCDIQKLNEYALEGRYEVTAISFHTYPEVQNRYVLLTSGASFGEKDYGPLLVKRPESSGYILIGVPGFKTTAFLLLKLWNPHLEFKAMPFDQILNAVVEKKVDAGLLIHEGQLTYQERGLQEVLNFGKWWYENHKLPLPLGGNAIRRDLPTDLQRRIAKYVKASIEYSLAHREAAVEHALQFARDLPKEKADRFVGMYVNARTVEMKEKEKRAVQILLDLGYERGLIKQKANLDWISI